MNGPSAQLCAIDAQIGRRLRQRRCDLGLTPAQLAFALEVGEVDLLACEAGRSRVGAAALLQLCKILQVRVAFFYRDLPANDVC